MLRDHIQRSKLMRGLVSQYINTVVQTLQLSVINSFDRYFYCIIQPVPVWDFLLLLLVFLKAIYLGTWKYGNHSIYLLYLQDKISSDITHFIKLETAQGLYIPSFYVIH